MFYCQSAELQGVKQGIQSCEISKSFVDWISTSVIMFHHAPGKSQYFTGSYSALN